MASPYINLPGQKIMRKIKDRRKRHLLIVIAVFGKEQTGLVVANEEGDGEKDEEDV